MENTITKEPNINIFFNKIVTSFPQKEEERRNS